MTDKETIDMIDERIESLVNEGTTLEGYTATSQAIAQLIIASEMIQTRLNGDAQS